MLQAPLAFPSPVTSIPSVILKVSKTSTQFTIVAKLMAE